ncbi:MAG: amidohydrolase [Clostridiales Family XIII bacterium]|jgi:predicted amidohydrolase YtcJ|nr:amidohydrolase [Clostridiales Family XIII bacterium]
MQADILIVGDSLFDSVSDEPFAGYVAVKGERIAAVGTGDGAEYRGAETRVIDAGGSTVLPGFHDSHTHLLMAGMYATYPNLSGCRSEKECVEAMASAYAQDPPPGEWVIGFGWYHIFWDDKIMPTTASLDRCFPDRPVILLNAEAHGIWVNSKALEIAGISASTPPPEGGEILRLSDGRPSGVLLEGACGLVTRIAYEFAPEEEKELIRIFMRRASSLGITSIGDVMPYFHGNMGHLSVYSEMDKGGELAVRIHAAPDLLGDLDEVLDWQRGFSSDYLRVAQVKQFVDGVSTTHTALMIEPYADDPGNTGVQLFPLNDIARAIPEAHRRGLSVRLHACGDASARFALDCYDKAIAVHGANGCRHTVEHCELIDEQDFARFGRLGVVPSVQPEHLAITQTFADNPYPVTMGEERAGRTWPLKRLLRSAGHIAIGSDCPVVDNNPFLEIYRGVTRLHDDGEPAGGWNPTEKLTLSEVLKGYTMGSAWCALREDEIGSLEPGKFADIAVVDRDIFALMDAGDAESVKAAQVALTLSGGRIVYGG